MSSHAQISISKDSIHDQGISEITETSRVSNKYHHFWAPVTLIASIIAGLVFWAALAVYFWL
ncbi:MAG: hypothetical protein ACRBBN_12550 [Methyloligellaceae bacterium]